MTSRSVWKPGFWFQIAFAASELVGDICVVHEALDPGKLD